MVAIPPQHGQRRQPAGPVEADLSSTPATERARDAIGLSEDFSARANRIITGNYLAGGAHTIYAGQRPGGPPTSNIAITGKQLSNIHYPLSGHFGCVAYFNYRGHWNTWSHNRYQGQRHDEPRSLQMAAAYYAATRHCAAVN